MYSNNDWRSYTHHQNDYLIHSDTDLNIYSENDYRYYLEHKFSLPNIKLPNIDLSKVVDTAKNTFNAAVKKVSETVSSLSKTISDISNKSSTKETSTSKDSKKEKTDLSVSNSSNKEKSPVVKLAKWIWPNGKNSKEYNAWYYSTHKEKWGVGGEKDAASTGKKLKIDPDDYLEAHPEIFDNMTDDEKKQFMDSWNNADDKQRQDFVESLEYHRTHTKGWKNMTDEEKKAFMDEQYDSDNSEMFISQFIKRPLSILSYDVGSYANEAVRDLFADFAYIKTGVQTVQRKLSDGETDSETGFKMKNEKDQKKMSNSSYQDENEDLSKVNPGYWNWNSNTKSNCALCTVTYDLRRKGYDVTANTATNGFYEKNLKDWYPGVEVNHISSSDTSKSKYINEQGFTVVETETPSKKLINELNNEPDGSHGYLGVYWNEGGGHAVVWEKRGDKVVILDGQSNTIYENPYEILQYTTGDYYYARLDNAEIDPEAIQRCAKS